MMQVVVATTETHLQIALFNSSPAIQAGRLSMPFLPPNYKCQSTESILRKQNVMAKV